MFRYAEVADSLAALIERGLLKAGDRLPSVRHVAETQRVSMSTAVQAYWMLEDRGLVETRARSGHFVRQRPEPAKERVLAGADDVSTGSAEIVLRILQAGDRDAVSLASAYPAPELLPLQKLNALLAHFARDSAMHSALYDAPPGRFELRLQIARRLLEHGITVCPEDVVITVGAAEAIHLCLAACVRPGDLVAVESPASFVIIQRLEMLGVRIVELPSDRGAGHMLDVLRNAHLHTPVKACVLMPSFSNPGGTCMPDDVRKDFVRFVNEQEIAVVEDDVSGDLHFGARRPPPLKAFDRKNLVMLCSSFSKTLAPGYRVGWAIGGVFQGQIKRLKFATSGASPVLPQLAIAEYLRKGGYGRHLEMIRCRLAAQMESIIRCVRESFPPGTRIAAPQGGTVVWVELPERIHAFSLERLALEEGITIAPGPIFSASGKDFRNFIRIGCGHPLTAKVEAGIRRLGAIAEALASSRGVAQAA